MFREGAEELTLRADGGGALRTFIGTTNVGDQKTLSARPFSKGSRSSQWETMYFNNVELHKAAKCEKS